MFHFYGDDPCPPTPTGVFLLRWAELKLNDPVIRFEPGLWRVDRLTLSAVPPGLVPEFRDKSSWGVLPRDTHQAGAFTPDDTVTFGGVEYRYLGQEKAGLPLGENRPTNDASLLPWQLERDGHIWQRQALTD